METSLASADGLVNYQKVSRSGNSIRLVYKEGWVQITAYSESIARVQTGPTGTKPCPEGYAVVKRVWPHVAVEYTELDPAIEVVSGEIRMTISKSPFTIRFRDGNGKLLTESTPYWDKVDAGSRNLSGKDEHFFGFGLQFHRLDQRGQHRTIKTNADPPTDNGMAHAPDPFFYSTRGYGIFLNSHAYSQFDMCASKPDEYKFTVPERTLDYFLIYGPSFRVISGRQTWLRGRMQMPPKWGLGFWYRMPSGWSAEQTINAAKEFRKREIPCDVIGLEPRWQTYAYPCSFVWNKDLYPDPATYVKWMRDNGFHLNLWEHQWVHPSAPIYEQLKANNLFADKTTFNGAVPDFTIEKTRDIFARFHESEHISLGVDGYKLDECDGSDFTGGWFYPDDTKFPNGMTGAEMHNLSGFLYNQAFHDMFSKLGLRTYIPLRANFAGGQRYPSCIYSDYYQLPQYIRAQSTSCFSGFLWCPELREAGSNEEFLRRAENMFFSPMAMINAWAGDEKLLPWNRDKFCEEVFRKYVQLRMRLVPYIYSSFHKTYTTGLPFIRALVMDYPEDSRTYRIDDQFMFGESMMIAPLVSGTSRRVYLPKGKWTDFWTDKTYEGGRSIEVEAPLDTVPVFVKTGAVIPMGPVMQHVGEKPVDEIELHIYPGPGSFTLYDDDGSTTKYLKGDNVEVPVEVEENSARIGRASGKYKSDIKMFVIKVHKASVMEVRMPFGEVREIEY